MWGLGGYRQTMQFDAELPDDDEFKEYEGQPKGMHRILLERGMLKRNMIGDCKECKQSKSRKAHVVGLTEEETDRIDEDEEVDTEDDDDRPADCCMRRALGMQQDFKDEKSLLEKASSHAQHGSLMDIDVNLSQIIEEAGDVCHFLPKFHPELNPIEYYWGWSKNYFRERSTGNFAKAKDLVQEALNACPLLTIRRFFRRAFRYASVYRLGATGLAAEFAVRKFKSHRHVRMTDLEKAETERKAKLEKEVKHSLVSSKTIS